MTDEEKAKEYARRISKPCLHIVCNQYCSMVKQAYLDGLAEGRKELEQWKQEWQDAQIKANEEGFTRTTIQIKYKELEKENAELKEKLKNNPYVIQLQNEQAEMAEDFCKQIENLKGENRFLYSANQQLNSMIKVKDECAKEYIEQIERMKNFVKSMYEANKNDTYCREYLGTILNEWS